MTEFFKMTVDSFEALGVAVLILGFLISMGNFIKRMSRLGEQHEAFRKFRQDFGRSLLLSLDLLVAADIILTVALDLTFEALAMLGLLVIIRTFLHFVLELEVTGRFPWQEADKAAEGPKGSVPHPGPKDRVEPERPAGAGMEERQPTPSP